MQALDEALEETFGISPEIRVVSPTGTICEKSTQCKTRIASRVDTNLTSPGVPTDAENIRARWGEVLDLVKAKRKVAWILLSSSTVSDFDTETLTLEFSRDWDAKGFAASDYYSTFDEALEETFRIKPKILAVSPTGASYEESAVSKAPSARRISRMGGLAHTDAASLAPGDRVVHDSYGYGVVLESLGTPEDPEAEIDFGERLGARLRRSR